MNFMQDVCKSAAAESPKRRAASLLKKASDTNFNLPKIVSAGLAGLAGGAAFISVLVGKGVTVSVALFGSVLGAVATGLTEYIRERKVRELKR